MLRVYSILYIERLWTEKPKYEEPLPSIESVLDNKNDNREVIEQESIQEQQQLLPVQEEVEISEEGSEDEAEGSNTNNNDFSVEEIVIETNLDELQEQEEDKLLPTPVQDEEQVVESLKIDTQLNKEEEPRGSLSSDSSVPSPLPKTPTSNYSLNSPTNSHRKATSLIRRETTKLNDRRKSLANKLKKALNNDGGKKTSI